MFPPSDTTKTIAADVVRRVSLTGRLALMNRAGAQALIESAGGRLMTTVSRRTTALVVGMDGWPLLADGSVSKKLQHAESLRAQGVPIAIISERRFLEYLGIAAPPPAETKTFDATRVCDLLSLSEEELRRWEVMGLIRSDHGLYDFQDIVSLRTLADLMNRGVKPHIIARSVRQLGSVLDDTDRPVAQLRLVEESGTILAQVEGALIEPSGQHLLDFNTADPNPSSCPHPTATPEQDLTASDWLEHGVECEESELYLDAIEAYRRALAMQPRFPEAHFNLGNVLRALGRIEAAGEHFHLAIGQAPDLTAAWFNLADVQEALENVDGAISSLHEAIARDPQFADAHFNLAVCLHDAGGIGDACTHWREFLKLDPVGPWADEAREWLRRCEHHVRK